MVLMPGRPDPVDDEAVASRAQRVPTAHLVWRADAGGPPSARPVLPLVRGRGSGSPGLVLALTYAELRDAVALGRVGEAVLVLDPPPGRDADRSTAADRRSWLLPCRLDVTADPEGEAFAEDLLGQELRRRPGSRLLADSPLLRREHPWFLPRLLVSLHPIGIVALPRADDADHLLVVDHPEHLDVRPVAVPHDAPRTRGERLLLDVGADPHEPLPATLAGHASSGDRERSASWRWTGRWDGSALVVHEAPEHVGPPPVPGVMARWRAHRGFETACRQGLRESGLPA